MDLNITKDAAIDRYNLEKEATLLPSVMAKYQEAILDQTRRVDNLKLRKEKEEAVARQEARKALLASEGKPTQAMVDDAVSCLPTVLQLRKEVAEEERELAYLKSCIAILEVKRRSLDNLVALYSKDYYNSQQVEQGISRGDYKEADVRRKTSVNYDSMADMETEKLNDAIRRK